MTCKFSRFLIFFLVCVSCSPGMLMVERPIMPGSLTVIQLSEDGSITQHVDQLPLPGAIAGLSDIVARDGRVYIASYKQFLIVESDESGQLQLISSLSLPGYDTALALHSTEAIAYATNSQGLFVVDVRDLTQPRLVKHLSLSDELAKLKLPTPLKAPVGTDIGCEDNKLVLTLQGKGESPNTPRRRFIPSRGGIAVVFDVEKALSPRIESALDPLSGAAAVAMGLYHHQVFVAGDELVEYKDFKREPTAGRGLWFKSVTFDDGTVNRVGGSIPGDVIEMKFVMGSRTDWESGKTAGIVKQYRRASPEERRELEAVTLLDAGVLFIATEHTVVSMMTSMKFLIWQMPNNRTASDYYPRLCGIDAYGYSAVYVAAGANGVYVLKWNGFVEFTKRAHLQTLPAPALDVASSAGKLYVLCGELNVKNVQHNERLTAK